MKWLWFALAGAAGGVLGGMGMGGGTVLIPVLTLLLKVPQHEAQAINLVCFLPMSACALVLHARRGLVDRRGVLKIIIPALLAAAGGSFLARAVKGKTLSRLFGAFLVVLSFFQFRRPPSPDEPKKPPALLTPTGEPLGCRLPKKK